MKLFRIEHKKQKVGPFNFLGEEKYVNWASKSMDHCIPNWVNDFSLYTRILRKIPDVRFDQFGMLILPQYISFCKNKSQLRMWIKRRNTLNNLGFVVVEYETTEENCLVGDFQCIAKRDTIKRIRSHKITEFFKR